jgi:hypothetical protein
VTCCEKEEIVHLPQKLVLRFPPLLLKISTLKIPMFLVLWERIEMPEAHQMRFNPLLYKLRAEVYNTAESVDIEQKWRPSHYVFLRHAMSRQGREMVLINDAAVLRRQAVVTEQTERFSLTSMYLDMIADCGDDDSSCKHLCYSVMLDLPPRSICNFDEQTLIRCHTEELSQDILDYYIMTFQKHSSLASDWQSDIVIFSINSLLEHVPAFKETYPDKQRILFPIHSGNHYYVLICPQTSSE